MLDSTSKREAVTALAVTVNPSTRNDAAMCMAERRVGRSRTVKLKMESCTQYLALILMNKILF